MSIKDVIGRVKSIITFEILRYKTKKYVHKEGFLIDKDILFYVYVPATDYYYIPYFQLYSYKNVVVNFSYVNSNEFILKTLRKSSNSSIYKKYVDVDYDPSKKYVFFFDGQYSLCSNVFRDYLKSKYPNCDIIFHLGDLLSTHKNIKINEIKDFSDMVVTYDHNDADNNGLAYHSDPYSQLPIELLSSDYKKRQILYCGLAKNRSEEILRVYDIMKQNNISCDFIIPDLKDNECQNRPELANAQFIPYLEYLKRLKSSDCVLEIIQKGSRGCTFRTWEAIAYNKKLITNNVSVKDEEFYNPHFIQVIDTFDSIDLDWINSDVQVDYGYADKISPRVCFEFYLSFLDKN